MKRGLELGIVTGIMLTVFIGWIPIVGPIVSGFIAGLHTKDNREGAMAGFISGAVGSILVAWVLFVVLVEFFVQGVGSFAGIINSTISLLYAYGPVALMLEVIALASLGGALGSEMRSRWSAERKPARKRRRPR
ncbi:MAG: DUF5518 domain-containing protein [Candidatus Marsarchaeota archaeon]|nr:DUF5518 domain-containing protein [Candidatus Marsarchaeota archaeon]